MEIVQERLEREFGINLITTRPASVTGLQPPVHGRRGGQPHEISSPNEMAKIEEPVLTAMIITAEDSVAPYLQLCEEKRGVQKTSSIFRRSASCSRTNFHSTKSCSISTTA